MSIKRVYYKSKLFFERFATSNKNKTFPAIWLAERIIKWALKSFLSSLMEKHMYSIEVISDSKVEFSQNSLDLVLSKLHSSHEKLKKCNIIWSIVYHSLLVFFIVYILSMGKWPQDGAGLRGRLKTPKRTTENGIKITDRAPVTGVFFQKMWIFIPSKNKLFEKFSPSSAPTST